jgi:hypothetical protein
MATVMSWGDSDGTKGRCDGRCHNAKKTDCHCMCGGRYHGTVANGSFDQVRREHGQEIIDAAAERARAEGWDLHATAEAAPCLFDSMTEIMEPTRKKGKR